MTWYWVSAIAVVVVVAGILRRFFRNQRSHRFNRLVALCHNDRDAAQRLVAGESRRNPDKSPAELVERAIDRLLADRRR